MSNARRIADVAPTLGRKNLLINGDFSVWQRGASGSIPLSVFTYTADRWVTDCYGAALTWAQGNTPASPSYNPGSLVITGASGNTGFSVHQRIEAANSARTYGKKLTVSGQMYLTGASRNITPQLYRPNTKNVFTSLTLIDGGTAVAHPGGGIWVPFEVTFANTMPAEVANGLTLLFTSGAHGAGVNFALSEIQLEVGEEATDFELQTFSQTMLDCQRFYEVPGSGYLCFCGDVTASYNYYATVRYQVPKRAAATLGFPASYSVYSFPVAAPTPASNSSGGFTAYANANATGPGAFIWAWTADAEL